MKNCLVCGASTRHLHMSIDACRACAMFYKRMQERKRQLVCRTGSLKCDLKKNKQSCKKCRFECITFEIRESQRRIMESMMTAVQSNVPITMTLKLCGQPAEHEMRDPARDVIGAAKRAYAILSTLRRNGEWTATLRAPATGKEIVVDGMLTFPATYGTLNQTTLVLLSALFEFAAAAFPEFKTLQHKEQWQLVGNFFPYFFALDSAYRMHTQLPERSTMCFLSYTSYMDVDTVQHFLADTPSSRNHDEASRLLINYMHGDLQKQRAQMQRWDPSVDEFAAFLALSFWSFEKMTPDVNERINQIADSYRLAIFEQLDQFYRTRLRMSEYAARMGEAALFLASIPGYIREVASIMEMFKLMDIVDDKLILYKLHKKISCSIYLPRNIESNASHS